MPGIPQGRDIGEAGAASVTLVSVGDDNRVTLEQRSVAALRFDRIPLDCSDLTDWSDLLARLQSALRQLGDAPRAEEYLVVRPVLSGVTPLAWRMIRDHDRLTEEARSFAPAGIWIDKLELQVSAPGDMPASADMDLPGDLVKMVLQDLPDDPGLRVAIADAAQELLRALPADLRDILGQDQADLARLWIIQSKKR